MLLLVWTLNRDGVEAVVLMCFRMKHKDVFLALSESLLQTSDKARDTNTPTQTLKLFSCCARL